MRTILRKYRLILQRAAGAHLFPAALCCILLVSFIRITVHNKNGTGTVHLPESMTGFVYRAAWNKENQFIFITEQGNLLLDCKNADIDTRNQFKNGLYIKIDDPGTYAQYPKPATNPGAFDHREYLYSRKIQIILPYKINKYRKSIRRKFHISLN